MSLSKYESEIKILPLPIETVYARFSDLRNLETLRERLNDPAVVEKMGERIPADKMTEAKKYIEQMTFTEDTLLLTTPVGAISLCIVEREAPKLVKLAGEGSPLPIYIWLQLVSGTEPDTTKLRVTVGAEVNFFMKGMVAKPLQQAADGLAGILSLVR